MIPNNILNYLSLFTAKYTDRDGPILNFLCILLSFLGPWFFMIFWFWWSSSASRRRWAWTDCSKDSNWDGESMENMKISPENSFCSWVKQLFNGWVCKFMQKSSNHLFWLLLPLHETFLKKINNYLWNFKILVTYSNISFDAINFIL